MSIARRGGSAGARRTGARPCGALRWGGLELVLAALLVSAGCKGSSAADVSVTVSAAAPAVLTRGQVQLAAEVTGADDTTVTWSASAGAIDAAGLFTAPADLGPVVVTATSSADPSRSATATVSVHEIPTLAITTTAGAAITSTETYVTGTVSIDARDGTTAAFGPVSMKIRGRGNSTWTMFPKKPYKLKLDAKASLLGMPADKEWALLANYSDKTLLRNDLAMELSRRLGLAYTPRDRFVEVTLNGSYVGTYSLFESVKVAADRVDITSMKATDTSGDALSGGYLVEVDNRLDGDYTYTSSGSVPFVLKDPDPPVAEQLAYVEGYLQDAEDALYSTGFADEATGYRAYLDADSFLGWYLVNEIFKNVDANFYSSCFMYKDRGGKLFMGPVWDFDLGAGNVNYNDVNKPYDPEGWYVRLADERVPGRRVWLTRLFEDPAFLAAAKVRWAEIKETQLDTLRAYVDETAAQLAHAQEANFGRWQILGTWVWPNPDGYADRTTYASEVAYLEDWLDQRIAWMDSQLR